MVTRVRTRPSHARGGECRPPYALLTAHSAELLIVVLVPCLLFNPCAASMGLMYTACDLKQSLWTAVTQFVRTVQVPNSRKVYNKAFKMQMKLAAMLPPEDSMAEHAVVDQPDPVLVHAAQGVSRLSLC